MIEQSHTSPPTNETLDRVMGGGETRWRVRQTEERGRGDCPERWMDRE